MKGTILNGGGDRRVQNPSHLRGTGAATIEKYIRDVSAFG